MTTQDQWERLQKYLDDHNKQGTDFDCAEYAAKIQLSHHEASADIQAYLYEQRRVSSEALYVLRRVPGTRTRGARWAVGMRTHDVALVGVAFYDDVVRKAERGLEPDLRRIAEINPRAARKTRLMVSQVLGPAMQLLAAAVQSDLEEDGTT